MCVPYTGTEAWTSSLGYNVIDEWRPWISGDDNQVAGYAHIITLRIYAYFMNSINLLMMQGAGHTVPEYKPRESLDFFTRFLDAKPI
ncbi:Serine carboxypeptidase-like 21 [Linum perenne]